MRSSARCSKIALLTLMFGLWSLPAIKAQVYKYAHKTEAREAVVELYEANNQPNNICTSGIPLYNAWENAGFYDRTLAPSCTLLVEAYSESTPQVEEFVSMKNYIIIEQINEDRIIPDYDYEIEVQLQLTPLSGPAINQTVVIPYSYSNASLSQMASGQTHQNRVALELNQSYKAMQLLSFAIWDDHASQTPPPNGVAETNFRIVMRIEEEVYDDSDAGVATISITEADPDTKDLELTLGCDNGCPDPGWFEVEWAFVDFQTNPMPSAKEALDQNATRISTDNNSYRITNNFPRHGIVYARSRYVRPYYDGSAQEVDAKILSYSPWAYTLVSGVVVPHEVDLADIVVSDDLNWVYSASYAEEGKKVETITYADGTGRARQNLTLASEGESDQNLILQETKYDYSGNPVIEVAPAPLPLSIEDNQQNITPEARLKYRSGVNEFVHRYEGITLDNIPPSVHPRNTYDSTGMYAGPLDSANWDDGASHYYSRAAKNGGALTDNLGDFTPTAFGFPYTYSEVDGSGRVRFQNIMGPEHHLIYDKDEDNIRRYTKMIYGQPTQGELDLYFGNNAAVASNYVKVVTEDANGQSSVSIVDKAQRPVFSGIGLAPENLLNIDTKPEDIFVIEELLGTSVENQALPGDDPNSMLFEKEIVLADNCSIFIGYDLIKPFISGCFNAGPLCYECEYEYEISLYKANDPSEPEVRYVSPAFDPASIMAEQGQDCPDFTAGGDEFAEDVQDYYSDPANPLQGVLTGRVTELSPNPVYGLASYAAEVGESPQLGMQFQVNKGKYILRKELRLISDAQIELIADDFFETGLANGCYKDEFHFTDSTTSNMDYECVSELSVVGATPCDDQYAEMVQDMIPNQGKYAAFDSYANWLTDCTTNDPNDPNCGVPLNDADTFSIFAMVLNQQPAYPNLVSNGRFSDTTATILSDISPLCNHCGDCSHTSGNKKIRYQRYSNPRNTPNGGSGDWIKPFYSGQLSCTNDTGTHFLAVIGESGINNASAPQGWYETMDFNGSPWLNNSNPLTYSTGQGYGNSPIASTSFAQDNDEVIVWTQQVNLDPGSNYLLKLRLIQLLKAAHYEETKLNFYLGGVLMATTYIDDVNLDEVRNFSYAYNGSALSAYLTITIDLEYGYGSTVPFTNFGFGIDDIDFRKTEAICDCENSFGLPNPPGMIAYYPYQCLYSVFQGQSITEGSVNPALLTIPNFIDAVEANPEWMDLLIQIHPEYCSWLSCEELYSDASVLFAERAAAESWDYMFGAYGSSTAWDFDQSLPNTGMYEQDPLFQNVSSGSSSALQVMNSAMVNRLTNYWNYTDSLHLSLEQMAMFITLVDVYPLDTAGPEPDTALINTLLTEVLGTTWEDVKLAEAFWERYSAMYLQLRQEITGFYFQDCMCSSISDLVHINSNGQPMPGSNYATQQQQIAESQQFFEDWLPSGWTSGGTLTIPPSTSIPSTAGTNVFNQGMDSLCVQMESQCETWIRSQIMTSFAVTATAFDTNGVPTAWEVDSTTDPNTSQPIDVEVLVAALVDECATGALMDVVDATHECIDEMGYGVWVPSGSYLVPGDQPGTQDSLMTIRQQFNEYIPEATWSLTLNPYLLNVSQPYYVMNEVRNHMQDLQITACPDEVPLTHGALEDSLTAANNSSNNDAISVLLANNPNIRLYDQNGTMVALPSGSTTSFVLGSLRCDQDIINHNIFRDGLTLAHSAFLIDVTDGGSTVDTLRGIYLDGPIWQINPDMIEMNVYKRDKGERLYCPQLKDAYQAYLEVPLVENYLANCGNDTLTDPLVYQAGYLPTLEGFLDEHFREFLPLTNALEAMATCRTLDTSISHITLPAGITSQLDMGQHLADDAVWIREPNCIDEEFPSVADCDECDALHEALINYQYTDTCNGCVAYDAAYQAHYDSLMDISNMEAYLHNSSSYSALPNFSIWPGSSPSDWDMRYAYTETDANWNDLYGYKEYAAEDQLKDLLNGLITTPLHDIHANALSIPAGTTLLYDGDWRFPVKHAPWSAANPMPTEVDAFTAAFSDFDLVTLEAQSGSFYDPNNASGALIRALGQDNDFDKMWIRNCSDGRIWIHMAFLGSDVFHDIWVDYSYEDYDVALDDFTQCISIEPVLKNGEAYEFIATYVNSSGNDTIELKGQTSFPIGLVCEIPAISLSHRPEVSAEPARQENCEEERYNAAMDEGRFLYQEYVKNLKNDFALTYKQNCMSGAQESMIYGQTTDSYNNTLYFYDRAGNLTQTIPPSGVHPFVVDDGNGGLQSDPAKLSASKKYRDEHIGSFVYADQHTMATTYEYNVLNEVVKQETPDGGITRFGYDRLGRIGLSQNARQFLDFGSDIQRFSYTLYDDLSRIVETGEFKPVAIFSDNLSAGAPDEALEYQGIKRIIYVDTGSGDFAPIAPEASLSWQQVMDALGLVGAPVNTTVLPQMEGLTWLMNQMLEFNPEIWAAFVRNHAREHVVQTHYDAPPAYTLGAYHTGVETNLRNRVSAIYKYETLQNGGEADFDNGMVYHYDISGNVKTLFREFQYAGFSITKQMDYVYDQISGNVHEMRYQEGEEDQLLHRYEYDGNNRLTMVETSRDGVNWHRDASYDYYLHGPLESMSLGHHTLQSIEYAYTINGWLKLMNPLDESGSGYDNSGYAADVFAQQLDYYTADGISAATYSDYKPVGTVSASLMNTSGGGLRNLYNGNIAAISMSQRFDRSIANDVLPTGRRYAYDQLHRIKSFNEYSTDLAGMAWDNGGLTSTDLLSTYKYDGNGNITELDRTAINCSTSGLMDDMGYQYVEGTNRLLNVCDIVAETEFIDDIDPRLLIEHWHIVEDFGANLPPELTGADLTVQLTTDCVEDAAPWNPLGDAFETNVLMDMGGFLPAEDYDANDYCRREQLIVQWVTTGNCNGNIGDTKYALVEHLYEVAGPDQFVYDPSGNLLRDNVQELDVQWNPIGKVASTASEHSDRTEMVSAFDLHELCLPPNVPNPAAIYSGTGYTHLSYAKDENSQLEFDYDPMGERAMKSTFHVRSEGYDYVMDHGTYETGSSARITEQPVEKTEFYVRDATGNLIALYRLDTTLNNPEAFYSGMLDNITDYEGVPHTQTYQLVFQPLLRRSYNLKENLASAARKDMDDLFTVINHNHLFNIDSALRGDLLVVYPEVHGGGFFSAHPDTFKAAVKQTNAFRAYAMELANADADVHFADQLAVFNNYDGVLAADAQRELDLYKTCVTGLPVTTPPSGTAASCGALGSVIFVDASATGTGSGFCWTDAFTNLDAAINLAFSSGVSEIWIAGGTYYPSNASLGYNIRSAVSIYGGFDGTETHRDQRDAAANEVILSGDIDQDGTFTGNANRIIRCINQGVDLVLDGLTIRDAIYSGGAGAGVIMWESSATNTSTLTVRNCRFFNNSSAYGGSGIYCRALPLIVEDCWFEGNAYTSSHSHGAGVHARMSTARIERSTFKGNDGHVHGSAVSFRDATSTLVSNCLFVDNTQTQTGAVYYFLGSNHQLVSSSFKGNVSQIKPASCVYAEGTDLSIHNCVMWGNTASNNWEIWQTGATTITVSDCIIEGGYQGGGTNILDQDPLFTDSLLHIDTTSPAYNAGVNSYTSATTDLNRHPRVRHAVIDLGAYEVGQLAACESQDSCLACEQYRLDHPEDLAGYDSCLVADTCSVCVPCQGDWAVYDSLAQLVTLRHRYEAYVLAHVDSFMNSTASNADSHYVTSDSVLNAMSSLAVTEAHVYERSELASYFDSYYDVIPYTDEIFSVVDKRKAVDATFMDYVADDWHHLATAGDTNSIDSMASIMNRSGSYGASELMQDMSNEWGPWVPIWMLRDPQKSPGSSGLGIESIYAGEVLWENLSATPYTELVFTMKPAEYYTYGSSRLGSIRHYDPTTAHSNGTLNTDEAGKRRYELADHLGNVRATMTDRKLVEQKDGSPTYKTDLMASMDYYPFGAPVQDRFESYELLETGNVTKVIDHHVEYTTYVYSDIDNGIVGDLELDASNGKWHAYATGYGSWDYAGQTIEYWAGLANRAYDDATSGVDQFNVTGGANELFLHCNNQSNNFTNSAQITREFDLSEAGAILDDDGNLISQVTDQLEVKFSGQIYGRGVLQNFVDISVVDDNGQVLGSYTQQLLGDYMDTDFSITVSGTSSGSGTGLTLKIRCDYPLSSVSHRWLGLIDPRIEVHVKNDSIMQETVTTDFEERPLYRFAFQGQERDDEVRGSGNMYAFTYRMHDPRIGRFLSIDPLSPFYPHYTPYSFSGNKVISHYELEGLEERTATSMEKFRLFQQSQGRPTTSDEVVAGVGLAAAGVAAVSAPAALIWASTHPIQTVATGGTLASALDPNPAADYTPGLPGDEIVGNMIGQGLRSLTKSNTFTKMYDITKGFIDGARPLKGTLSQSSDVLKAEISLIYKTPEYEGKVLGNLDSKLTEIAGEENLQSIEVVFKYVLDKETVGMYKKQAEKYGYDFATEAAEDGTSTVFFKKSAAAADDTTE